VTVDAEERAELNALRIRAYGPSSDIADDIAALKRLVELEELALPTAGAHADGAGSEAGSPLESAVPAIEFAADERQPMPPASREPLIERRPRRLWHLGSIAAVALLAIALGTIGGAQATRQTEIAAAREDPPGMEPAGGVASDPDGEILIRVFIDASTGGYVDLSSDPDVPAFPVSGDMTWAQPLGEYYGWALWIGAAPSRRGDEHCLLIAAESGTRSRCVAREWRADGDLLVSVPYTQIAPAERPAGMTPDQSVSFLWGPGGFVTILITPAAGD
jgi:hypothetical protein